MQIIHMEEKPLVSWKNGGGMTREIAVHFDDAQSADFLWRISQAVVDRAGAFSRFEGIDRTIAVLEGQGLVLKSQASEVRLDCDSPPYCFAGEVDIEADLAAGATTDLNVMTRRGFFTHKMEKISIDQMQILKILGDITFIICNSDMVINGQQARRFDAVTGFAKGDEINLQRQDKGQVFVIDLFAC